MTIRSTDGDDGGGEEGTEQQHHHLLCCAIAHGDLNDTSLDCIHGHATTSLTTPVTTLATGQIEIVPKLEKDTTSTVESVHDKLLVDTVDGTHPLTPPATPQMVEKFVSREETYINSPLNTSFIEMEREGIASSMPILQSNMANDGEGVAATAAEEDKQNYLQHTTPKTNVVLIDPAVGDNDVDPKTNEFLEDDTPIAFTKRSIAPPRSQSLSSLHSSDASSTSLPSSSLSPTATSLTPPLSKSASTAILTFTRNQRKGSCRKRKKRRDRHRK